MLEPVSHGWGVNRSWSSTSNQHTTDVASTTDALWVGGFKQGERADLKAVGGAKPIGVSAGVSDADGVGVGLEVALALFAVRPSARLLAAAPQCENAPRPRVAPVPDPAALKAVRNDCVGKAAFMS